MPFIWPLSDFRSLSIRRCPSYFSSRARSGIPLKKFLTHTEENVGHGKLVWDMWFPDVEDRDGYFTPFNTACFCTVDTCLDA